MFLENRECGLRGREVGTESREEYDRGLVTNVS